MVFHSYLSLCNRWASQIWNLLLPMITDLMTESQPVLSLRDRRHFYRWMKNRALLVECQHSHWHKHLSSSAPHLTVSGRLQTEERSDHCAECSRQQLHTHQVRHQRQCHGGHGCQDVGQGSADKFQTQVRVCKWNHFQLYSITPFYVNLLLTERLFRVKMQKYITIFKVNTIKCKRKQIKVE